MRLLTRWHRRRTSLLHRRSIKKKDKFEKKVKKHESIIPLFFLEHS
jgi:hypothetical protein